MTVSTDVKFCTHDNSAIKIFKNATDFVGRISVGANSFIGMNTIIMGGVSIPEKCIVGAGSVVTKSFDQAGSVIAGNPAKVIGNIDEIVEKKQDKAFDFRGMNQEEKRKEILSHSERLVIK